MIFDNVIEQIQAEDKNTEVVIVKLGEVSSVTPGGRAYVKLYGDGAPSTKLYTYIDGYFPEVGDKVALLPQGKTYIILGKVNEKDPVELYAKIKWVEKNFCPIEYKSIIEDASNPAEDITFGNYALLPTTDNRDTLGASDKNFKEIFIKKLTLDGESFTKIYQDRIFVVNANNTYSLIATFAAGAVTLTPSADNMWKLGTSAAQLAEVWTKLFRGAWKSGNQTERQLSWNSANAIVPDSSNSIDLGTSLALFKNLFLTALIGAKWQYSTAAANSLAWNSATELAPNNTDVVNFGSGTKQFNKGYFKELYVNGQQISPSGETSTDELSTDYGSNTYILKLSVKNGGASSQYEEVAPSVNKKFELGSSSYQFRNVYSETFTGMLDGGLKDGNQEIEFDNSHNLNPSTTNYFSLGTSNKQYKNVYAQNVYNNGTAVTSDRRKKKDIAPLDERYDEFFKALAPVSYKYKDGTSGRKHTGFIAQDVEQAAEEAGLTDKDIAVVVKDNEDNYYLRYEEIIAIQTNMIQKLMARVESLEARVKKSESERSKT